MSTTPTVPAPSWISLLVNLGANLGAVFVKNTQIGQLITSGVVTTTAIITAIQQAKVSGISVAQNLTIPIFVAALQEGLLAAVTAGKISASDAAEVGKALQALGTEDAVAKATVDYGTIGLIAPLP